MAATYEPIATTTLSSAASSITFSSIASSWTDLRVVLTGSFSTADRPIIWFNNDNTTNQTYSRTLLTGDGTAAESFRTTNFSAGIFVGGTQSSQVNLTTFDIFSYTGSTYKTVLATRAANNSGAAGFVDYEVGLWQNTSAITRIDLGGIAGNSFASGTTATLYGIKAA